MFYITGFVEVDEQGSLESDSQSLGMQSAIGSYRMNHACDSPTVKQKWTEYLSYRCESVGK